MLKKFSVLILAAVQILFCIGLTLYRPVEEWLIENKGTVYNLKVSSVSFSDEIDWCTELTCCIECDWSSIDDYEYHNVIKGEYAVIETDENGISHLAYRTDKKPKSGNYIKGYFWIRHRGWSVEILPTEEVKQKLYKLDIYPSYEWSPYRKYEGSHEITYDIRVYKGLYRVEGLSIDGIPIEEVLS